MSELMESPEDQSARLEESILKHGERIAALEAKATVLMDAHADQARSYRTETVRYMTAEDFMFSRWQAFTIGASIGFSLGVLWAYLT